MKFSKNMREFYKDHKIGEERFARLIGVPVESIREYSNGSLTDRETKLKIDIGIDVIEDYKMVFPTMGEDRSTVEEIRKLKNYEKHFHRIYDQILLAEL